MKENVADGLRMFQMHLKSLRDAGIEALPISPAGRVLLTSPLSPPSPLKNEGVSLEEIRGELGDCTRCKLCNGRKNIVFGEGNPGAAIMFIGEGPGREEDDQGRPFVGKAGRLLTKIIENGMNIKRSSVYITNIVKCRPPENRDPEQDEIESCLPFLQKQISAVRPRVIISLGKPAASALKGAPVFITRERGTWFEYAGTKVMPTFHPSYVLRNYTHEVRKQVFEDVKKVTDFVSRE